MTTPIAPDPWAPPPAQSNAPGVDPWAPEPDHSGVLSQVGEGLANLGHLLVHPKDWIPTIIGTAKAVSGDALRTAWVVQNPGMPMPEWMAHYTGGQITGGGDIFHDPVTRKAALNTIINLGFIPAGLAGRVALGATSGAANSAPGHRIAGATEGAAMGGAGDVIAGGIKALRGARVSDVPIETPRPAADVPIETPLPAADPWAPATTLDASPEQLARATARGVDRRVSPTPESPPTGDRRVLDRRNNPLALPDAELQQVADAHAAQLGESGGTPVDEKMHAALQSELQRRGLPASPDPWAPVAPVETPAAPAPVVTPPVTPPVEATAAAPVNPAYVGTPYEQAMNKGELGVPKPEAVTPTVAELGGAPLAEAIKRDPTSGAWRVTISDAHGAGQLAQEINVPDLVAGSRTTITMPEVHALAQSIGAAKDKLLSLSEAGLAETDPVKVAAIQAEYDATMAGLGDLGRKTGQGLGEAGRTLRAAQIMGDNSADPSFWLYQIKKTLPAGVPMDPAVEARVSDIIRAGLKERPVTPVEPQPLPIPPEIADAKAAVQDALDALPKTTDTKGVVTADFTDARFRAKIEAALAAVEKSNFVYKFSDEAMQKRSQAILRQAFDLHTDPLEMPTNIPQTGPRPNPIETISKYFEGENTKLDGIIADINHPTPKALAGPKLDPVTGLEVANPVADYITKARAVEKSRAANDAAQAKYEARAGAVLDRGAQEKLLQVVRDNTPSSVMARLGRLGRANLIDNPALLGVMGVSHGVIGATEHFMIHPLAASLDVATAKLRGTTPTAVPFSGAGGAYLRTFATSFKKASGATAARDAASAVSSGIVDKVKAGGKALWEHYTTDLPPGSPVAGLSQRRVNFNTRAGNLMNSTDPAFGGVRQRFNAAAENVLNGYTNAIMNLHRTVYSPFSDATFSASLQERAAARVLNDGLTRGTPAFDAAVKALVTSKMNIVDLTEAAADAMRAAAETDAERSVFQEPNKAARLVSQAARPFGKENVLGEIATQSILPFPKVPANIGWQSLVDLNPIVGAAKAGKLFASGEQLRGYQSLVRAGLVGGAAVYIGHVLASEGRISPPIGDQSEETQVNKQSNIPLTSGQLTVDGPWINLARFGPVGMQILLGAEITRAWKASHGQSLPERATGAASAALFGTTKAIYDQPFLQGTKQAIEALGNEPGAKPLTRILGNVLSRFIPGGSVTAAVARGVDPVAQRQSTGFLTEIQNRIPYLRNQSEPVQTPLGDVLPQQGGVAKQVFVPFTPTFENPDALSKELKRIGLGLEPVSKRTGELPAEFAARRALTDPVVRKVLELVARAPVYQQLRLEDQKLVLAEVAHRTRSAMGREVPALQSLLQMLHKSSAYLSASTAGRKALEAKVTTAVHAYLADHLVNGSADTTGQPE